ncbi:hypothetical protein G7076_10230 [Sphingomonas sp. HDW15A]|uniref:DUF5985 family protein n=1 Tax=Sphingomonas sp. HDW15A TaxID=2714942 RepID=UPI001408F87F|nr:DUF5985 family protein [Sphingomonas sp. HDW15A]QIK96763.1 hypothetical protein G7076_10230 [Sphingomonas sp. HDW15A]
MSEIFPTLVYLLCFLASFVCALLLGRGYLRGRMPLLFWSAMCFTLLALANLLVVFDMILLPDIDLRPARLWCSLAAVSVLIFGFLWAQEQE